MAGIRQSSSSELELILDVLADTRAPLSVSEIASAVARKHARTIGPRQIAYRLQQAAAGLVERSGERRGARYRLRTPTISPRDPVATAPVARVAERPAPSSVVAPREAGFVPSPDAESLRDAMRRPLSARRPVGYEREWLFAYEPGATWYLPENVRTHLRRIGTPPGGDRPAGTFARDILAYLLIDLAWASSHLEGNTYSLLDTRNLIEFGQRAEGTDADEAQMILNHKRAIELLVSGALGATVSALGVRSLHAALSSGLLADARFEGKLRETLVGIGGSVYQPTGIPQVIDECFMRIVETAARIPDAFEASFFLLVHLPYLQPFVDANKRTSRLAANMPLVAVNLSPLSFVGMPTDAYAAGILAVYELRRIELLREVFVWAYERSCERYVVVEQAVPRPDPVRLRYREQLDAVLTETVRGGGAPSRSALRAWAGTHGVPTTDVELFAEKALELLLALNDASAMRVGVRPEEFLAWRERFTA